jgi:hypothetical protein
LARLALFLLVHVLNVLKKFTAPVRGFAPIVMMGCWKNGIMGSGRMQYWVNDEIRVDDKIKNG